MNIIVLSGLLFIRCSINNTTDYYYKVTLSSTSLGTVCNEGEHLSRYNDTLLLTLCSIKDGYQFKEWGLDSMKSSGNCIINDRFKDTTIITQIRGSVIVYPVFTQLVKSVPLPPNVICVKQSALQNGGGIPGKSWVDAYRTLHEALAKALPGDSIWVAEGTYSVHGSDPAVAYKMKEGVSVFGGFHGDESELGNRDWVNNKTVLDGICGTDRSDTIVVIQKGALLDGFRISDGGRYGGYIRGSCKIRNCIFSNNSENSPAGGTALFVMSSNCEISGCVFNDNYGTTGSAILVYTGLENVTIANCVLTNNRGPAIYNNATLTVVTKSTIVYNPNPNNGPGGIYNTGTIRLESSIVWGNTNKDNLKNTQINASQFVDYCCIQDCEIDEKGVGSKIDGLWQTTNTNLSPEFENTTLPDSDYVWYSTSSNIVPPFVPSAQSTCTNASRVSISIFRNDIRGKARTVPFEIGAYERTE
jgi:hypothetical protein